MVGDQPVDGLPFRRHGAALGGGDGHRDLGQSRGVDLGRQAAGPEAVAADQRAVDDEIGVAADRRGEMSVAA